MLADDRNLHCQGTTSMPRAPAIAIPCRQPFTQSAVADEAMRAQRMQAHRSHGNFFWRLQPLQKAGQLGTLDDQSVLQLGFSFGDLLRHVEWLSIPGATFSAEVFAILAAD